MLAATNNEDDIKNDEENSITDLDSHVNIAVIRTTYLGIWALNGLDTVTPSSRGGGCRGGG